MVQTETIEWREVRIGPDAVIHVRPIDPEIQAKMPVLKPTRQEQLKKWLEEHFGKNKELTV